MNTDKIYAESVANEYSVKTSRKVVALQKLDRWIKRPAKIIALTFGSISFIINGIGLSLLLGCYNCPNILYGTILYFIGLLGMASAQHIYVRAFEYRKRKNTFDVIELASEIIEQSK